jgi:hypothetical protein
MTSHSEYDPVERPRHYCHHGGIEPFDFISSNNLDFAQGNIIKYVLRFHEKGGVVDLQKARWYIDRLIEQANADG